MMPVKERIANLGKVALLLMVLPILTGWYFAIWSRYELTEDKENPRNISRPELRGRLLDRTGKPLAYSTGVRRNYPLGKAAASLIGYFDIRLGASGMEGQFDLMLQGRQRPGDLVEGKGVAPLQRVQGPDVVLSLDADLQQQAYDLLAGRNGAIVLLHVPTGELLAAASYPSYDPRHLGDRWDDLTKDPAAPLFHRGLGGLYSPGSTFKVLTMVAALSEKVATSGTVFYCGGGLPIGDYTMVDSHAGGHGSLSLEEALAQSCNVTFGGLGLKLGLPKLEKWMHRTGVLAGSPDLRDLAKGLPPAEDGSQVETAQAGIGQGTFLVTPTGMARLCAVIARGGLDVPPRVYRAQLRGREAFVTDKPPIATRVVDAKIAAAVSQAMRAVVERGTGGGAVVEGYKVAGKTGTAENPRGKPDAWFIGFAPADKPLFAVCVMLENQGYGGTYSAPLAAKVLKAALKSPLGPKPPKPKAPAKGAKGAPKAGATPKAGGTPQVGGTPPAAVASPAPTPASPTPTSPTPTPAAKLTSTAETVGI